MTDSPKINVEQIAAVCHEANRAYAAVFGDTTHLPWDAAPEWQRESARNGVTAILEGAVASPQESHKGWADQKRRDGWVFGPIKDVKKKTHPCLLPWDELPEYQRRKDVLFMAVVNALTT